ncbi:MAG: endonuclease/exonuclease/phosphatase family protein [Gammaproteobacteria bacterium]|nr:endonuclease/exonuclease/phosphatase family protein [Gammaproteobacteria bacterium]
MYKKYLSIAGAGLLSVLLMSCASIQLQTQLIFRPGADIERIEAACVLSGSDSRLIAVKNNSSLNANRISLLNWNGYKNQAESWDKDFTSLTDGQDIILLQEALVDDRLYQLLKNKNLYWNLNAAFYYAGKETGVLTASKVDAIRTCGIRTTEPVIRTPKTALVSVYALNGMATDLMVINIHGINFSLGTGSYKQQIDEVIRHVKHHHGPVIVAGDFNNWNDARNEIINTMMETLTLQSVGYKNHKRITVFGNVIDHVFYRGLELIEENTVEVTSSDHNPIRVVFRALPEQFALVEHE